MYKLFIVVIASLTLEYLCIAKSTSIVANNINHNNVNLNNNEKKNCIPPVGIKAQNTASTTGLNISELSKALTFIQLFIYNLIIKLRDIQSSISQPISSFFQFNTKSDKNIKNGHIECNIETIGLSENKIKQIYDIFTKEELQNKNLHKRANITHLNISPHLIYRYLAAVDWNKKYNGRR